MNKQLLLFLNQILIDNPDIDRLLLDSVTFRNLHPIMEIQEDHVMQDNWMIHLYDVPVCSYNTPAHALALYQSYAIHALNVHVVMIYSRMPKP